MLFWDLGVESMQQIMLLQNEMNEQSSVVLQVWRRKAESEQRAWMIAATARGYVLGVKYSYKLWQADELAQNFIHSSLCCFSLHKQHPRSQLSRHVFAQGQMQLCCHHCHYLIHASSVFTNPLRFQEPQVLSLLLWIQQRESSPSAVCKHLLLCAAALLTRLGSPAALFILCSLKLNLERKATLLPSGKGSRENPCSNKPRRGRDSI